MVATTEGPRPGWPRFGRFRRLHRHLTPLFPFPLLRLGRRSHAARVSATATKKKRKVGPPQLLRRRVDRVVVGPAPERRLRRPAVPSRRRQCQSLCAGGVGPGPGLGGGSVAVAVVAGVDVDAGSIWTRGMVKIRCLFFLAFFIAFFAF